MFSLAQVINKSRPCLSRSVNVRRQTPPRGVAPIFAMSMSDDQSRSPSISGSLPVIDNRSSFVWIVSPPRIQHLDTIASFTAVSGRMVLRCLKDGTAKVRVLGRGYAPNSVLTVWIIWQNPPASGLPPILPQPLGGAPNAVVVAKNGMFLFERTLNFCPMESQNGSIPLLIDIAKHIDGGNLYGARRDVPLEEIHFIDSSDGQIFTSQGVGAGMMTVNQGVIPLLIQPRAARPSRRSRWRAAVGTRRSGW